MSVCLVWASFFRVLGRFSGNFAFFVLFFKVFFDSIKYLSDVSIKKR